MNALNKTWKELGLKSIERISNVALYDEEWTPDNDFLTAAMKLKRQDIVKNEEKTIAKLYEELDSTPPAKRSS